MDLSTTYLGLKLKNPLVVGASAPLTEDIDNIKRIEDAGASAVVLHSFFEEQLIKERFELEHHLTYGTDSFGEALTYFPEPEMFHIGEQEYLNHIRKAKETTDIPIIASLNGYDLGGWVHYAKQIEEAGADALELNIYNIPTDFDKTALEIEQEYIDIIKAVKADINIPLALKISPFFTNTTNMTKKCVEAGVDGLVLFNRFYQPDIDLESLEVNPHVLLSTPSAMRLPLRWIAILYGRIEVDFAATGGIHHGKDVIKMMMVGANITMVVSALLRHGIHYLSKLESEIKHWMEVNEYESIKQMRGSMSQINCPSESAFERAQYLRAIQSYQDTHILHLK